MGETVYEDERVRLEVLELAGRGGVTKRRAVIRHPGAVGILPLLDDGRVVLIRNRRPALGGEALLELPAGTREGDAPIDCAARELEEETGYRAATLEPLTSFYPSPGITDERMDVFVARGLEPGPQRLDPTEEIEVAPMAWGDALEAIREGRIRDGKTIASLLFWERFGPGAG